MSEPDGRTGPTQTATRPLTAGLAFLFGCVGLGVVLWLEFRGQSPNDQQFEIIRMVVALAGGAFGAAIPGFLDITVKKSTMFALRAGGGLAVFVILYFWSPAHWQPSSGPVSQQTKGNGSPAQNGDGNTVTVPGKQQR